MSELILNDKLFLDLESYRIKLYGQSFHDYESESQIEIEGLDLNQYKELVEYVSEVQNLYFRLKDSHDEIILSLKFLDLVDIPDFKDRDIYRSQYLTYHIKYWHIKLVTTYDLILKLVGNIYDLGIPDRFINQNIIEGNKFIKFNKTLMNDLKKIRALMEADIRNKIVHHQIFENHIIDNVLLFDVFNLSVELSDEIETKMNVEILIKKYYSKTELYTNALNALLDSLSFVFQKYWKNKEFIGKNRKPEY